MKKKVVEKLEYPYNFIAALYGYKGELIDELESYIYDSFGIKFLQKYSGIKSISFPKDIEARVSSAIENCLSEKSAFILDCHFRKYMDLECITKKYNSKYDSNATREIIRKDIQKSLKTMSFRKYDIICTDEDAFLINHYGPDYKVRCINVLVLNHIDTIEKLESASLNDLDNLRYGGSNMVVNLIENCNLAIKYSDEYNIYKRR